MTGQVIVLGQLPVPLEGAVAVTLDHHLYLAGGRAAAGANRVIWAWEPATATMVAVGHLAVPVANAGATVVSGEAWLVGGEVGGKPVATVQMFKPVTTARLGRPATGANVPTRRGALGRTSPDQPGDPSTTAGAKSTPRRGSAA